LSDAMGLHVILAAMPVYCNGFAKMDEQGLDIARKLHKGPHDVWDV
jgi:hypothetical protein